MAIIPMSEAEATRDFAGVMAKVRAGEEVRIDDGGGTVAVVRMPEAPVAIWTLSEAIRRAEDHGSTVTLDDQFGHDLEAVIASHEHERLRDLWAE